VSLLRRLHYLAALVFTLDARSIHPPHRIQQLHGHRTHRTVWRRRRACLALPAWPRLPAGAAVLPRRRYPRPTSQPAVHSYWRDFKCDRTRQAPRDFGRHAHSRSTEDSVLPNWTKACRDVRQSSTTVTDASGKLSCVLAHATRKAAVSWLWNMRSSLFVHTAAGMLTRCHGPAAGAMGTDRDALAGHNGDPGCG
jgi:hypothetical protein